VTSVFVVLNPVAGHSDVDAIRDLLARHFIDEGWRYEVHETRGDGRVAEVVRAASDRGFDIFVAAGAMALCRLLPAVSRARRFL
jgi:diacylglycerol kinase family enzyme